MPNLRKPFKTHPITMTHLILHYGKWSSNRISLNQKSSFSLGRKQFKVMFHLIGSQVRLVWERFGKKKFRSCKKWLKNTLDQLKNKLKNTFDLMIRSIEIRSSDPHSPLLVLSQPVQSFGVLTLDLKKYYVKKFMNVLMRFNLFIKQFVFSKSTFEISNIRQKSRQIRTGN